ncbi:MAG: Uncharacterized protein Greene041679_631, partial [Parcubacteria group bacterium Greene0416_79]
TAAYMNAFKLGSLYNTKLAAQTGIDANLYLTSAGGGDAKVLTFTNIILIGIFGSIFMIVSGFVFFAAAILFIIRTVTLVTLMILSPLAFVAWLLPGAAGMASDWWHKLWSQSFFAPLYLALSYIVVSAINSNQFQRFLVGSADIGTNTSWAAAITGFNAGSIHMVFSFILLIGLMVACLTVAQSLGAKGSEMTMQMWGGLKRLGMGVVGGATGILGRGLVRGTYVKTATGTLGNLTKGVGRVAQTLGFKKWGEKVYGQGVSRIEKGEKLQKKIDVSELDKKFGKTWFGNTALGSFVREQTFGRVKRATFGDGPTVHEAYEQDEKLRERREEIENKGRVKQNLDRLQVVKQSAKEFEKPEAKNFIKENGELDAAGFAAAMQGFLETYEPERSDYAPGPAGDTEFAAAKTVYENNLRTVPQRTAYGAETAEDLRFAADVATHAKDYFEKPSNRVLYGADLARAKKIADDREKLPARWAEEIRKAKSDLGISINLLSPQGFAEMNERDIERLSKYANIKQIQAVLDSKEYTMDKKRGMLTQYDDYIKGFREFQRSVDEFDSKMDILNENIGKGFITMNENHEPERTRIGPDGKRYALGTNAAGAAIEIEYPEAPPFPKTLREWARNDMTLRGYEIMTLLRPQALAIPALVQTVRWGMTHDQLRRNENIAYQTRDDITFLKDYKLWRLLDKKDKHYMPENTDAERAQALLLATQAAEAARTAATAAEAGAEQIESAARTAWQKTISVTLPKDSLRQKWFGSWLSDRAPKEIAGTRGRFRNSQMLHNGVDGGTLAFWRDKDVSDIQRVEADLIAAYIRDLKGVTEMTAQNKDALNWMFTNRAGKELPRPELRGEAVEELGFINGTVTVVDEHGAPIGP